MATATATLTRSDMLAAAEKHCPFWAKLSDVEKDHAIRDMTFAYTSDDMDPETYWNEGFTAEDMEEYLSTLAEYGAARDTAPQTKAKAKAGRKPQGETRDTLIAQLKLRNLKGYSGLNKAQLQEYLATGEKPKVTPKAGTAAALKAQCREEKLPGYSKLKKPELQEYLDTRVRPVPAIKEGTVDYYRELLKKHEVPKRSQAKNKAAMIALCKANGIKGFGL